jgi:DNA-binding beta-propeller fold protein YncE
MAMDVARQRLFVAALGNNTIEVIDIKENKLRRLTGCSKPQGLLYLPKPNLLFATCGEDGKVKIFDCDSFRVIKTLGSLPDADNVRYDAEANRIYVGFGTGALAVVNAVSGVHTIDVKLEGHPEAFQLEPGGVGIYVNVPQARHVAVISRASKAVVATWPLQNYEANFPMALDAPGGRLFVGCGKPPKLVVLDTTSGKVVGEVDIGGDTDDLFYDAKRSRLYVSCGEGSIDVLVREGKDQIKPLERITTRPGARTSLFVPEMDLFCVAVPQTAGRSAEIRVFRALP